ncbi:MAG: winged helix DNA-binding domain-containing protein [Bacteroidota bacterium]
MKFSDIANIRLAGQQISGTQHTSAGELLQWMGAMQAQDYAMATWAVGVRLTNTTLQHIESAINEGEILRTHLMRPTWHFVSSADIDWMLDLTSPQIKSSMKSRNKQLELTDALIAKSNRVISKVLEDGRHSTREELITALNKSKIPTDENRASHLFMCAELDKVICSGSLKSNKQTFALFDKRVKKRPALHREEAITKLAAKYFQSHCPATLQDFIWWSGLSAKDAKSGLENNKNGLISETTVVR